MINKRIIIEGEKVHNVGYRPFLLSKAWELNIPNYFARNIKEEDGVEQVEVYLGGDEEQVQEFIEFIKNNYPPKANVSGVREAEPPGRIMQIDKYDRVLSAEQRNTMVQTGLIMIGKQDQMIGKQDQMIDKQDQMIGKQDQMIGKQDQMIGKQDQMIGKQDQMIGKQDQMIDKQDETQKAIENMHSDVNNNFQDLNGSVKEVKGSVNGLTTQTNQHFTDLKGSYHTFSERMLSMEEKLTQLVEYIGMLVKNHIEKEEKGR